MPTPLKKTYYDRALLDFVGLSFQADLIKQVENLLKEYLNIKHAILTSNGTTALLVALMSLKAKNKTVAIPSFTFVSPALAAMSVSANIRFVDVTKDTLCSSAEDFFNDSFPPPDIIVPTHIGGLSCNMEELVEIANINDSLIIEDAAQAFGCEFNHKKLGTFGLIGIFSFGKSKIPTCGEGGLIVTNDDYLAAKIRSIINYGRVDEKNPYIHSNLGINGKLSELQIAFLKTQIENFDDIINQRDKNGRMMLDSLGNISALKPVRTNWNNLSSFYMPSFLYKDNERNLIINKLNNSNIPVSLTNKFPYPLFENPCFNGHNSIFVDNCINVYDIYKYLLVIGHPSISSILDSSASEVMKMVNNILSILVKN